MYFLIRSRDEKFGYISVAYFCSTKNITTEGAVIDFF